ncbi:MAG: ABC transporter permease subunit [Planctomycetales bacterium]|nr:ABC transporter permease subunit [Planctomycetales bacterium]
MNRVLLRKTFNDARWLLAACAGLMFLFSWIRVVIVSNMELHQIQRLTRNLPEFIQRLSPVPIEQLVSYAGLVAITFEEPIAYMMMAAWTFSRGSDCISGELGRGTLEMILAQPVGRMRYLWTHVAVTVAGVVLIALAAQAGTHVGINTSYVKQPASRAPWSILFPGADKQAALEPKFDLIPMTKYVQPRMFWTAALNYVCLGLFLAGLTTFMSAWDRYRWRTLGIIVGFYIIETICELTGMAVDGWHWLLWVTFFSLYEPVAFATAASKDPSAGWTFWAADSTGILPDLGPLGSDLLLLILAAGCFAGAAFVFRRRDLPAPL